MNIILKICIHLVGNVKHFQLANNQLQAQNNKHSIIVSWFSYSTIFIDDNNGKEIILILDLRNGIYKFDIKKQRLKIGEQSDWNSVHGTAAVLVKNKQKIHCLTQNGH